MVKASPSRKFSGDLLPDEIIQVGNEQDEIELLTISEENEDKINQQGKPADAIVKSMLEHSQKTTGVKEPTDINLLVEEYYRLAYHSYISKEKFIS